MSRQLPQPEIGPGGSRLEDQNNEAEAAVSSFDFSRLDRVPKSQLRAIHLLHENFVRSLASSLSAYFRTYASLNLVSLEQSSYSEFLESLSSPTCITYIGLHPYDGTAVLELNNDLMFSLIELLLGGNGKTTLNIQRKITDIEKALIQTLMRVVLHDLSEAWKSVADIRFAVQSLASEPQLLHVLAPAEAVVVIAIEVRVGPNSGVMNLAIPSIFIKRLRHKFDQLRQARRSASTQGDQDHLANLIQNATVVFEARIIGGSTSARRLLDLNAGDVLMLDHPLDRRLSGLLNGVEKLLGSVVSKGEKLAFQVLDFDIASGAPDGSGEAFFPS